jgi:ABC-2 type transport system permease protein
MNLRVLYTFLMVSLRNELTYRANFFMHVFDSLFTLGTSLTWLSVIFSQTDTLLGWKPIELVAVVSTYTFIRGILNLTIKPSFQKFIEDIQQGTLDFTLIKPMDSQWVVSIQQLRIWSITEILLGLIALIIAMVQMSESVSWVQILLFLVVMILGLGIIYSFLLMLTTCAFWFIQIENVLEIFESMYQAGRWPLGIYPKYLRYALTFLVPIAFAVTVPAEVLTHRLGYYEFFLTAGLSVTMLILSRWFWKVGLRHYSGASS